MFSNSFIKYVSYKNFGLSLGDVWRYRLTKISQNFSQIPHFLHKFLSVIGGGWRYTGLQNKNFSDIFSKISHLLPKFLTVIGGRLEVQAYNNLADLWS